MENGKNSSNSSSTDSGNSSDGDWTDWIYDCDIAVQAQMFFSQPNNIISLCLGLGGLVANLFSIFAISRLGYSKLSSHIQLLISLAASDLTVCLSFLLHMVNTIVQPSRYYTADDPQSNARCFFMVMKALNTTGLNITLLNLMAMAIDLYLAIVKPLHYTLLLSKKRTILMILSLWVVGILCGFSDFLAAFLKYYKYMAIFSYCDFVWVSKYQDEYTTFALATVALFVMVMLYMRIYREVRLHRIRISQHVEYNKNKKALLTTLLILGTFVGCWLPVCLYQIVLLIYLRVDLEGLARMQETLIYVDRYIFNLLLVNTIADPLIYAVRVREVQIGYRRLFCQSTIGSHHSSRRSNNGTINSVHFSDVSMKKFTSTTRWSRKMQSQRNQTDSDEMFKADNDAAICSTSLMPYPDVVGQHSAAELDS